MPIFCVKRLTRGAVHGAELTTGTEWGLNVYVYMYSVCVCVLHLYWAIENVSAHACYTHFRSLLMRFFPAQSLLQQAEEETFIVFP